MISEAVAKIAEADLGSFGDFKEKDGKIMVVVENSGEKSKVVINIQGELDDNQIQKAAELIKSIGGDELQLSATLATDQAPEFINRILVELTGNPNVDIEIELAVE